MKRILTLGNFLFGIFWTVPALSLDAAALTKLIRQYEDGRISIGAHVLALQDGTEVFAHRHDQLFNPASNLKIITTSVALAKLGVDYRFSTPYTTEAAPQKGRMGNLYIRGSGDPSLVEERLWRVAKDLAVRGVEVIAGDIVIDQSLFDAVTWKAFDGDAQRAFRARITPYALNYNSFAVIVTPHPSGLAVTSVDPVTDYFSLSGRVVVGKKTAVGATREFRDNREVVKVYGSVKNNHPVILYRSVSHPTLYAGLTLKKFLEQNGITVHGHVRSGPSAGTWKLFTDKSKPLSQIVYDINKYSNNFGAEMVVKTLGAQRSGSPGTTAGGVAAIRAYLSGLGVPTTDYYIENGSGLSRQNKVTPRLLTRILRDAKNRVEFSAEFMASLAIGGVDGTVSGRLSSESLNQRVRVKTGTLSDVSSLAGFLPGRNGADYVFAVIAQGPGAGSPKYHRLQEQFLQMIADHAP